MQALSERLQANLDTFNARFGKKAEEDENRIWAVTNINKPEHERVTHTINGSVIAQFIFSGDYEIDFVGWYKPKDNAAVLKERRANAVAQAQADLERLKAENAEKPEEATEPIEESEEVLVNPSAKKVKQKE